MLCVLRGEETSDPKTVNMADYTPFDSSAVNELALLHGRENVVKGFEQMRTYSPRSCMVGTGDPLHHHRSITAV